MSVFVTGDIHGDPRRLNTESFYEQKQFLVIRTKILLSFLGILDLSGPEIPKTNKRNTIWTG